MDVTIALVQMRIAPSDPVKNLGRMEIFVKKAVSKGAQLIVFPEDAVCGPLLGQTSFVQHAPAYLEFMQKLAVKYSVDLVPGSWTVWENGLLYNQVHYINADGTVAGSYRKINLWETEKVAITPGSIASVFPTRFGNVGLIVCWDIAFPALFAEMNAQAVELVIAPTYWSFTRDAKEDEAKVDDEILLIDSLCTTRAFENNILFAYCNAAGEMKLPGAHTTLSGRSQITHPLTKVVCQAEGNREETLIAHVSLDKLPLI